jgi:2-polyprenyl-6-methoxyphenol hydroxylase-like FAD-dependent oxidoreductase
LIPGKAGNTEVGNRLVNWVWYCNYPADSEVYHDLMTDSDGHHHHFTLPVGKIQLRLVEQQKQHAAEVLSPQFAELVQNTRTPFVQAITDVLSPQTSFMDGKLLLVGDAVAGFRPHTAASTNQATYHALLLEKVFGGEMEMREAQEAIMQYAGHMSDAGKKMGNRSQFRKSGEQVGQSEATILSGVKKDTD